MELVVNTDYREVAIAAPLIDVDGRMASMVAFSDSDPLWVQIHERLLMTLSYVLKLQGMNWVGILTA